MKKIVSLCLLVIFLSACELDNGTETQFVVGPVQYCEMPASFKVDSISTINVSYARPDNCHIFNGFYYAIEGNTRTVAIEYAKMNRNDCEVEQDPNYTVPLNFKPRTPGTYLFRFWDGVNDDGSHHFYEVEVEVPN